MADGAGQGKADDLPGAQVQFNIAGNATASLP